MISVLPASPFGLVSVFCCAGSVQAREARKLTRKTRTTPTEDEPLPTTALKPDDV
jgi:hypothetical protein